MKVDGLLLFGNWGADAFKIRGNGKEFCLIHLRFCSVQCDSVSDVQHPVNIHIDSHHL